MKTRKRVPSLVTCLAVCFSVQVFSREVSTPDASLTFERASTVQDSNASTESTELYGAYVAEMKVRSSPSWFFQAMPVGGRRRGMTAAERGFVSRLSLLETLTRIQRERLQAVQRSNSVTSLYTVESESDGIRRIKFHAVTEKDARAMSQFCLSYALDGYRARTNHLASRKASRSKVAAALKKTIAELEQGLPQAEEEFETLKTKVFYRSSQDAEQAVKELNRILTAAQVDTAGEESAIETIWDLRKRPRRRTVIYAEALEQMLTEHRISLKALQGRAAAARNARTQAIRYIELERYTLSSPKRLQEAQKNLSENETQVAKLDEQVAALTKPEVVDNKVTLHRITESQAD